MIDKERLNNGRFDEVICNLDSLVPKNHIIRKIEKAVNWDEIYYKVSDFYSADKGRPSVNPVILIKIALIEHIFHIGSLRQTVKDIEVNLAYRWFIGRSLVQKIPHFSTVSCNFTNRIDKAVFSKIFTDIIDKIAEKRIFEPHEIIYESDYLKNSSDFTRLAEKYGIEKYNIRKHDDSQLSLELEQPQNITHEPEYEIQSEQIKLDI